MNRRSFIKRLGGALAVMASCYAPSVLRFDMPRMSLTKARDLGMTNLSYEYYLKELEDTLFSPDRLTPYGIQHWICHEV